MLCASATEVVDLPSLGRAERGQDRGLAQQARRRGDRRWSPTAGVPRPLARARGIRPIAVRCPRVRDRVGEGCERIRFSSGNFASYARRSKSLEVLMPILYLKGISTGDFEEALIALLGKDGAGLSASTIGRLKHVWSQEHARWSKRDLWSQTLRLLLGRRHLPVSPQGSLRSSALDLGQRAIQYRSKPPHPS